MSTIDGVAQVNINGQSKYAVRVQLDPNDLVNKGISFEDVQNGLGQHNANLPTGTLWGAIKLSPSRQTGSCLQPTLTGPSSWLTATVLRCASAKLGRVIDSVENDKNLNTFDGRRSMTLQVMRQPGTNTVEIVDRISACCRRSAPNFLPQSVSMFSMTGRNPFANR